LATKSAEWSGPGKASRGDPSSDRRFQLGTDRQFAVSHRLELNTWLEFNT